jgi:hypothetical protein
MNDRGFVEVVVSGYAPGFASVEHRVDGAYAFTKSARLHWLQHLCLRILDKLGCQYMHVEMRVETYPLDRVKVEDFVHRQVQAFQRVYGEFPGCIIVGQEQANELFNWDAPLQFAFEATDRYMGITIIIAPYFDGVVCLRKPEVQALFE